MITNLYSVFDLKANAFMPIFFAVNDAVAIRSFIAACTDDGHNFASTPEDYCLYHVGTFNDETGSVHSGREMGPEMAEAILPATEAIANAKRHVPSIRSGPEGFDT